MSGLEPGTMAQALADLSEAIAHLGRTVARAATPRRAVAQAAHAKVRDAFTALAEHVNAFPALIDAKEEIERNLREQLGIATATLLDDASAQLDADDARAPNVLGWRILAAVGWILFVAREFTR